MKIAVTATALCLIGLTAPSPAHADGVGYVGSCHLSAVNDTTPGGAFGGQQVWNGEVDLAVTASTPGDSITAASCWIKVNAGPESKILDASTPLPAPAAFGAGRATFTASDTDTVYLCTHVTTGTDGPEEECEPEPLICIDLGPLGYPCIYPPWW